MNSIEPILQYKKSIYDEKKSSGSSYTPQNLSDFVARQILGSCSFSKKDTIRVLDPAVGDGELLIAVINNLIHQGFSNIELYGFDTNDSALEITRTRLANFSNKIHVTLEHKDFLDYVLDNYLDTSDQVNLCSSESKQKFDIVIANPPYVRTQVLGSEKSKRLAVQFGLSGRVDLYHAFIFGISNVLRENGILGIIVSNRFMTTKAGFSVRECFLHNYKLHHVWDMGDTKLFEEAVLPAVLIGTRSNSGNDSNEVLFTSTYTTSEHEEKHIESNDILNPLLSNVEGVIKVEDIFYKIKQGKLEHGISSKNVWRITTTQSEKWLGIVDKHRHYSFKDIGKIRVGMKTTADKVFNRDDWNNLPKDLQPEQDILKPLLTHKQSRRWKPKSNNPDLKVLYTHEVINGKRQAINIDLFPKAKNYLESNKERLDKREYIKNSNREWYEIWVPHNPAFWDLPKIVFRDISEDSIFFMDLDKKVVNGDCYWMIVEGDKDPDLLWLALAVGNSSFILKYYDEKFHNKLYSNRRRFMTQYVEDFPVPNPELDISRNIIKLSKELYEIITDENLEQYKHLEEQLNHLVWESFGLIEE